MATVQWEGSCRLLAAGSLPSQKHQQVGRERRCCCSYMPRVHPTHTLPGDLTLSDPAPLGVAWGVCESSGAEKVQGEPVLHKPPSSLPSGVPGGPTATELCQDPHTSVLPHSLRAPVPHGAKAPSPGRSLQHPPPPQPFGCSCPAWRERGGSGR